MNKLDPALRRSAFIGWPESIGAGKRAELMRKFGIEKYPGFSPIDVGHDFTGPITTESYVQHGWNFQILMQQKLCSKKAQVNYLASNVQALI